MSTVTVAQFKAYASKADGDATKEALYQTYIDAAEAMVAKYLGYSPASATYTSAAFYGDGKDYLQLKAKPITALSAVSVAGVSKTTSDFDYSDGEWLKEKNGNVFPAGAIVLVTYTAGFSSVPAPIIMTTLRLASLLSVEANENIGVTSQSFDGGNSRSFLNFTNFDRYLQAIEGYKLTWLGRTHA